MKIVCDACQAKYSISDDKVQGKVFKIRCKKCSNIIVVRGGASEVPQAVVAQEKDTRVYDYGYEGAGGEQAPAAEDAVWHLVINQDQVGPMTVAEVQQRFAAGEIDAETFTWREGFGDWLPLAQVDAFSGFAQSGATSDGGGGGGAAAIGAMFGSGDDGGGAPSRNDPGDLFASASAGSSRGDEDDNGSDLFGAKPSTSGDAGASAAASSKLRGERNENSVLFSLNNLAQLASDKPAMSAPSGGGGGAGHATGAAGGEGSGLIDIRSMASAYMGGGGAGAMGKPQTASAIGSIDDLPVFGGGGFSEPAVLVPTMRSSGNNKMLYMMIAAVSLLAIVAIAMVVILMKGGKDKAAATTGSNAIASAETGSAKPDVASKDTTGSAAKPAVVAVDPTTGSATGSASGSDLTARPDTTVAKADPATTKATPTTVAKKDTTSKPTSTATHTQVAAAKPDKKADATPAPTPKADTGGCDEVSCVLNNYEGACCSKFRKSGGAKAGAGGGGATKPAAGGGGDLPDSLDRSMISSGIANVKARVTACGDKSPAKGKVKVHVKVGGDGRVANVAVESTPDAALGACVAGAVQKASFSKTQSGGSFSYPFVF